MRHLATAQRTFGFRTQNANLLIQIQPDEGCRQAKRRLEHLPQRAVPDHRQPFRIRPRRFCRQRCQFAARVHRQPHVVVLVPHRRFKTARLVRRQDFIGKGGNLRARHRQIEPERCRHRLILLVRQPVGQSAHLQRPFIQNFPDKGLVVDIPVQPVSPQRHAQQAPVRHQRLCRFDAADLFAEIRLVPLRHRVRLERGALCRLGALQKRPPRIAAKRDDGAEHHDAWAANRRSSRGSRTRSAFSA